MIVEQREPDSFEEALKTSFTAENIDRFCDEMTNILDCLKYLADTTTGVNTAIVDEAITPEVVEALDRLDLYMKDEATHIQYYYRLLIARNPKMMELVSKAYKETHNTSYEPDFSTFTDLSNGNLYIAMNDN